MAEISGVDAGEQLGAVVDDVRVVGMLRVVVMDAVEMEGRVALTVVVIQLRFMMNTSIRNGELKMKEQINNT